MLEDVHDGQILVTESGSDHCPTVLVLKKPPVVPEHAICALSSEFNRKVITQPLFTIARTCYMINMFRSLHLIFSSQNRVEAKIAAFIFWN